MVLGQVAESFELYVKEIYRKIKGYEDPTKSINYAGLELAHRMRTIVDKSDKENTSYIALKEAEKVFCDVEEVMFDAQMVKAELKKTLDTPGMVADASVARTFAQLKSLDRELDSYIAIVKDRHQFVKDVLFGLTSINASVRAKFGDTNTFGLVK